MGKTVSLRGAAAGAFVDAMRGKKAESEDEMAMRIATFIFMEMKIKNEHNAKTIVLSVARNGLAATAECLTTPLPSAPPTR